MPPKDEFTQSELEMVMSVFKQYETGLREACIDVKVGLRRRKQTIIILSRTCT